MAAWRWSILDPLCSHRILLSKGEINRTSFPCPFPGGWDYVTLKKVCPWVIQMAFPLPKRGQNIKSNRTEVAGLCPEVTGGDCGWR